MVADGLEPSSRIKWILGQFHFSQKQYTDAMGAKSHKAIRTETQLIAAAFDDNTPEMAAEGKHITAGWLHKVQQLVHLRWCGAAH